MSEIGFGNFNIQTDNVYDIGDGVIPEMAGVFEHDLSEKPEEANLGTLISKVGPAKTFLDNLTVVRNVLGENTESLDMAIDWVDRSGLLVQVERSFVDPSLRLPDTIGTAIISGGVRNWMQRRSELLDKISSNVAIERVLLVAGNRVMNPVEGVDVLQGMTEAEYMEAIIRAKLIALGRFPVIDTLSIDSTEGLEVLRQAVVKVGNVATTLVVGNAGNVIQNAGQYRRAGISTYGPSFDSRGNQLFMISDEFPVARHGEPAITHQNPYMALGQIARNAQELVRHQ